MLDFVFITVIFFEIILTALCVVKLIEFEKKCIQINEKLILTGDIILAAN